jgi:hypothetical protein
MALRLKVCWTCLFNTTGTIGHIEKHNRFGFLYFEFVWNFLF